MKNTCMSSDYIPQFFPNSLQWTLRALPILNSCMKDRCGFLFVFYKRHCCTELVSWEHAACPLSGNKKRPLVGGWSNISSVVISIGATASVRYREVVCSWEGSLWEVPLYTSNSFHFFRMWLYLLFQWLWKSYCTKHLFPMRRIYHWHSNAWVFIRNFPKPQQNLGSTCGDTTLQEVPSSFCFCSRLWHSKSTVNSIEDSSLSLDQKHQHWVGKVRGLVSEHLTNEEDLVPS